MRSKPLPVSQPLPFHPGAARRRVAPRVALAFLVTALATVATLAVSPCADAQPPAAPPPDEERLPANNDVMDATDNTDTGLIQVELGGTFARHGSSERTMGSPVVARYGAFDWLELSLGTDGYLAQTVKGARTAGLGNLSLGSKVRLWTEAGGMPMLSVAPVLTVPTAKAASGLGSGVLEYGVSIVAGRDLPHHGRLDATYGAMALGLGPGLPHVAQHALGVTTSVGMTAAWTESVTAGWVSRQDAEMGRAVVVATGAVVTLSRRVAVDLDAQVDLAAEAPGVEVTGGLSMVIGELDRGEGVHARRHALRLRRSAHRRTRAAR
ncbi:MAG: transporter [Vicinamibacterales bacterium]